MNIALIGYGKMGREIERVAKDRNITIKRIFELHDNLHGIALMKESLHDVDVCIDFTTPVEVIKNIAAVAECGKNIVVGTTGWYNRLDEVKKIVKNTNIGLLYSPNFSIGMNIFTKILTTASEYFNMFDTYDAAIHETHHRGKVDSPSGTALALGQTILQHVRRKKELLLETSHHAIKPEQLHITSARVGNVVGKHDVVFDSDADTIELVHTAKNRGGFALGALVAAEWLKGKKGVYTMNDVITLDT